MSKNYFALLLTSLMLSGCLATYGGKDPGSKEGQLISYQYEFDGVKDLKTEAVFRKPAAATATNKVPAVIVLHDGGGWSTERTRQYADLFTSNGYATLEPRLYFDDKAPRTNKKDLASLYAGLSYLSKQPEIDRNRIYAMGMSAGAMLAMLAKTQSANELFNRSDTTFRAIASMYPVCWLFTATIEGNPPKVFSDFTASDMKNWQPMPIRLFIPEFDDYEDRDATTCENFITKIPSEQARSTFSIKLYPGATHGWDHGRTYSFNTWAACKGRGCVNTNQSNPAVTQQGYKDVLSFFGEQ
ncbi:dienelactone hydrolase family protein [Orrella daihaiensis]|uniref:Dienelactone hydrolase family protein n=1 Tax=Orrella daihaiensis TaxID=2782176 RepID=A0ABY4AM64_9BURK|nr:dienelactone hydrolase family protein [Orrella daihaiensis]UOD50711.1 dienelactone hydrolase family protein [Orrella daihaiensis]